MKINLELDLESLVRSRIVKAIDIALSEQSKPIMKEVNDQINKIRKEVVQKIIDEFKEQIQQAIREEIDKVVDPATLIEKIKQQTRFRWSVDKAISGHTIPKRMKYNEPETSNT